VPLADLAWCALIGLAFGRLEIHKLLRRAFVPAQQRYVLPLASALKALIPVGIAYQVAPGPTLPVVVALFTVGAHLIGSGRTYVLWVLLGASVGLHLFGLGLALGLLALAALHFHNESLMLLAGPLIAGAVFMAPGWYNEDIHILWTFVVLGTSLLYLSRGLLRRHRTRLGRLRAVSGALLCIALLLTASHVAVGRQGFVRRVICEQIISGPPSLAGIALTFDDGPDPQYTPAILKVLRENDVKATFFMVGSKVRAYPEIARQVAAEGHVIGNHSYTHRDMGKMSREQLAREIDWTQEIIEEVCGVRPLMFRPPRGVTCPALLDLVAERNMVLALWSVSSRDWLQLSPGNIVSTLSRNLKPGAVLLFHDSGDYVGSAGASRRATVRCLPGLIKAARQRQLELVCMDTVLAAVRETGWYAGLPSTGGVPAEDVTVGWSR